MAWLPFVIALVQFLLDLPEFIEKLRKLWDMVRDKSLTGRERHKRRGEAYAVLQTIRADRDRRVFAKKAAYAAAWQADGHRQLDKLFVDWEKRAA